MHVEVKFISKELNWIQHFITSESNSSTEYMQNLEGNFSSIWMINHSTEKEKRQFQNVTSGMMNSMDLSPKNQ